MVQRSGDAVLAEDGPVYEFAIDDEDFERYRDIVDEIVPQVRPIRTRMQDVEDELANLVMQVLESTTPWTADIRPIGKIAGLFEWRIVPYLLNFGDFIDGFNPASVRPLPRASARGIALSGTCFLFSGREAPFEADIAISSNDKLSQLELRFGDASFASTDAGIIPSDAPDVTECIASGYRTVVRKNVLQEREKDEQWAFVVVKLPVSNAPR